MKKLKDIFSQLFSRKPKQKVLDAWDMLYPNNEPGLIVYVNKFGKLMAQTKTNLCEIHGAMEYNKAVQDKNTYVDFLAQTIIDIE